MSCEPSLPRFGGEPAEVLSLFPPAAARTVPNVVNNHVVRSDLIHDQVVADRNSPETRITRCLPYSGIGCDLPRGTFDAGHEARSSLAIVGSYVCKNLSKIGKRATLISQPHAPR